jgi:hypothetical protein
MSVKKEMVFRYKPLNEKIYDYNEKDKESIKIVVDLIIKKVQSNGLEEKNHLTNVN